MAWAADPYADADADVDVDVNADAHGGADNAATDVWFEFDDAGQVQYLVTSYWVAVPDPTDGP